MTIVVIDGQGGKIGARMTELLVKTLPEQTVVAVGTNTAAADRMRKAGAHRAAVGENAAAVACRSADIVTGPLGIAIADSMLGEISPRIAFSVARSPAVRVLIPVGKCDNIVVGSSDKTLSDLMDEAVEEIRRICGGQRNCGR